MIVILHGARAFGAVENYLMDIVAGLQSADEPVVLLYPDDPILAPFAALEGGNVRVEPLPRRTVDGPSIMAVAELAWRLRRLRPRIVHMTDVWSTAMVASRFAGKARVIVTHHAPSLPRSDSYAGKFWWRAGWATKPEVIYVSESTRQAEGRRPAKVIYCGIDLERFRDAAPALRTNGPTIGNVARLSPEKGQRFLLEAAPRVLERHPQARFVLVGEGPLRSELEMQAHLAGIGEHVLLTGQRSDVPALLASFDVFAMPSLREGLPYALIEAQAAGVPVVATPVGGIQETVVDGATGLLVPIEDPIRLADSICWLLENPGEARAMAVEAQKRARVFSKERMIEETIALYGLTRSR